MLIFHVELNIKAFIPFLIPWGSFMFSVFGAVNFSTGDLGAEDFIWKVLIHCLQHHTKCHDATFRNY